MKIMNMLKFAFIIIITAGGIASMWPCTESIANPKCPLAWLVAGLFVKKALDGLLSKIMTKIKGPKPTVKSKVPSKKPKNGAKKKAVIADKKTKGKNFGGKKGKIALIGGGVLLTAGAAIGIASATDWKSDINKGLGLERLPIPLKLTANSDDDDGSDDDDDGDGSGDDGHDGDKYYSAKDSEFFGAESKNMYRDDEFLSNPSTLYNKIIYEQYTSINSSECIRPADYRECNVPYMNYCCSLKNNDLNYMRQLGASNAYSDTI